MNIAVIGLGLIGGSICKTIRKNTSYSCWGMDTDAQTVQQALQTGAITRAIEPEDLRQADLTIVCLHPQQTIDFILQNLSNFQPGSTVIDVCGVKKAIIDAVTLPLKQHGVAFIGTHPMAGREFSGFAYAQDTLFDKASFIITPLDDTPKDKLAFIEAFAQALRFKEVVYATPEHHDQVIAFTSQLAHVVSNAYVKSPSLLEERGFSAGSFLDLTRVAKLNEDMWTSLFMLNREPLLFEIETLIQNLEEYRQALQEKDAPSLHELLREGRILKEKSLLQNSTPRPGTVF